MFVSESNVPVHTFTNEYLPIKGSTIVFHTFTDRVTLGFALAVKCSPVLTSIPSSVLKSGDGKYLSIALSKDLNPCT